MSVAKVIVLMAFVGTIGGVIQSAVRAQATKPPVVPHATDGRAACLTCHGAKTDSTKAVPEDHVDRPNEACLFCHGKDAAMQTKKAPQVKHTAQGRANCLMCHSGKMATIPAPPEASHAGMLDIKFCTYCHQPATP
jgi:nitrate reductase cytochrome c-type subunit